MQQNHFCKFGGGVICILGVHYFFRDWMHFLAGLCWLCCRWLCPGGVGALCLGRVPCASVGFGSATLTAFLTSQETTGGGCRETAWDTTTHLHNGWTLDIFSIIYRVKPFCLWDWISLCVKKYSQEKWLSPSAGLSYCPGSSLERGWLLVQFIGIEIRLEKKNIPPRATLTSIEGMPGLKLDCEAESHLLS